MPLVSCILPTYGRPPAYQHLVEEAVESFLRQTYQNKELILLNDAPGQELVCDAPGVHVVNLPERYPSLGEKRNAGVRMSRGEIIAMWDDDDISLPWRLSHCMEQLGENDYFNSHYYWYMDRQFIHPDVKVHPAGSLSVFRRSAFEEVGGFPLHSFNDDVILEEKLRYHAAAEKYRMPNYRRAVRREIYYIYRWGFSPVHISGQMKFGMYEAIAQRPVASGTFEIVPHWRMDYSEAVRSFACPGIPPPGKGDQCERADPVPGETHGFLSILSPVKPHVQPETPPDPKVDEGAGICIYV